jgi:hypothetical protein
MLPFYYFPYHLALYCFVLLFTKGNSKTYFKNKYFFIRRCTNIFIFILFSIK